MRTMVFFTRSVTALLLGATLSTAALATDDWPAKPLRIIVPYSPGGSADVISRLVAEKLAPALGQPVLVENRTGGAAIVGTQMAVRAAPDGYTLLAATSGPIAVNPVLYSKLPYAPEKDLTPISMIASFPLVLVVQGGDKAFKDMNELRDYTKAHPDKSNYGSSATSTRLAVELLKSRTGINATHIPFKGSINANNAVVSGEVTMSLSDLPTASALIQANRLKGLAVASEKRVEAFPDIPTLIEQGVDVQMKIWVGLFAPAGTPAPIVTRLQQELSRLSKMPDVRESLGRMRAETEDVSGKKFARIIATETEQWGEIARANNIRAD